MYQLLKRLQSKNSLNRLKIAWTDSTRIHDVDPGVPSAQETTVNCWPLLLQLAGPMDHWTEWKFHTKVSTLQ